MMRQAWTWLALAAAVFTAACNLIANSDPKPWDGHADVLPEGVDTLDMADHADGPDAADGEAESLCGNRSTDPGEDCDDGNEIDGDGCDSDCTWTCTIATAMEDCDDGDNCTVDGCTPDHMCEHDRTNLTGVQSMSAGASHTCAVLAGQELKCWGRNDYGQLGNGNTEDSELPVDVVGLDMGVQQVAAGRDHTCALLVTGAVMCWGRNDHGQLGDDSTASSVEPVVVQDLVGFNVSISAGLDHTCVLKETDGSVWCWGANETGQLGDGTSVDKLTPVVIMASGVMYVSAGLEHTCAVMEDGTARCWGKNADGQLGINSIGGSQLSPVQVVNSAATGSLSDVTRIFAGGSHTCGIVETTATLTYCWGDNSYGQRGDNMTDDRSVPTLISDVGTVIDMDLGSFHTCALTDLNRLYCWGRNNTGQIGIGGTTDVYEPTPVGTTNTLSMVTAGGVSEGGHTCAVTGGSSPGEALCWGWNSSGQLGDGTEEDRLMPTSVLCN